MKSFVFIGLLFPLAPSAGAQPLSFEMVAEPGWGAHREVFPFPPFLALVLENNQIPLSNAGKLKILDKNTLSVERTPAVPYKNLSVKFLRREADRFLYEGGLALNMPPVSLNLTAGVEVDTSFLKENKILVRVQLPGSSLIPKAARVRVQSFIQNRLNPTNQQKILHYLSEMKALPVAQKWERVLMDAYNRSGKGTRVAEPGDAEPISDQWLFFVSLLLWVIGIPLLYWKLRPRLIKR